MSELWQKIALMLPAGFADNALANATGTIVGGLILPAVYFLVGPRILRWPNVSGPWMFDTLVKTTKYNPHRNMLLRYKVLLLEHGGRVSGTAEKVFERADTERSYIGKDRERVQIEGTIRKEYLSRSSIFLHMVHDGQLRESSSFFQLRCSGWGQRLYLDGIFASTASDSSGTVRCIQVPLDQRIDEYHGLPIGWIGRVVEWLTRYMYQNEWSILQNSVSNVTEASNLLTQRCNLRLPVAALVLGEDHRFYRHGGIDPIGMLRAVWRLIASGIVEGASTLEQQFVRTLLGDYRLSLARKFKEIILASRLYRIIDKESIPVAYLTVAHFGWGMDGLARAATRLGIDLKSLAPDQVADLIARIKYPEPQYPRLVRTQKIELRKDFILRMINERPYLIL